MANTKAVPPQSRVAAKSPALRGYTYKDMRSSLGTHGTLSGAAKSLGVVPARPSRAEGLQNLLALC
jgi:hypothetical protein